MAAEGPWAGGEVKPDWLLWTWPLGPFATFGGRSKVKIYGLPVRGGGWIKVQRISFGFGFNRRAISGHVNFPRRHLWDVSHCRAGAIS